MNFKMNQGRTNKYNSQEPPQEFCSMSRDMKIRKGAWPAWVTMGRRDVDGVKQWIEDKEQFQSNLYDTWEPRQRKASETAHCNWGKPKQFKLFQSLLACAHSIYKEVDMLLLVCKVM